MCVCVCIIVRCWLFAAAAAAAADACHSCRVRVHLMGRARVLGRHAATVQQITQWSVRTARVSPRALLWHSSRFGTGVEMT